MTASLSAAAGTAGYCARTMLAQQPRIAHITTQGSSVEVLTWGAHGKPGLFLLHGAGAHAHWWDGFAPLLADDFRVAAMTLPGNGASGWRDHYSSAAFWQDICTVVAAVGLDAAGPAAYIGHSMGGAHLMHGAVNAPSQMRGLILVDTSFRSPGRRGHADAAPVRKLFASEAEALSRFRLMPPSPAREQLLVDHVARHAITEHGDGWSWRADPAYWDKFVPGIEQGPYAAPLRPMVPTVHIVAEASHVAAAIDASPLGPDYPRMMLADCGHHATLDRPLALAKSVRSVLEAWAV